MLLLFKNVRWASTKRLQMKGIQFLIYIYFDAFVTVAKLFIVLT